MRHDHFYAVFQGPAQQQRVAVILAAAAVYGFFIPGVGQQGVEPQTTGEDLVSRLDRENKEVTVEQDMPT